MYVRQLLKCFLIIFILLLHTTHSPAYAEKRTALVIGNASYNSSPLKNPTNDASDIAKSLEKYNFKVIKEINATRRTMIKVINQFYNNLKKSDVGFFYYAGHGVQVSGHNYLIPIDANITSESDVELESVDARRILGKMKNAGNRLNIVILDACRNNPYKKTFRGSGRGLARLDAPRGAIVAIPLNRGKLRFPDYIKISIFL